MATRTRNQVVAFRVTPTERRQINARVRHSGLSQHLTDQKPNVLYTMPVQTVERLEEILRQTLALQKAIQTSMQIKK